MTAKRSHRDLKVPVSNKDIKRLGKNDNLEVFFQLSCFITDIGQREKDKARIKGQRKAKEAGGQPA